MGTRPMRLSQVPLRHKETPAVMAGVVSFSAQCLLRLNTSAGPIRIRKARMGAIWDNCCLKSRPCNWVCGW